MLTNRKLGDEKFCSFIDGVEAGPDWRYRGNVLGEHPSHGKRSGSTCLEFTFSLCLRYPVLLYLEGDTDMGARAGGFSHLPFLSSFFFLLHIFCFVSSPFTPLAAFFCLWSGGGVCFALFALCGVLCLDISFTAHLGCGG